MRSLPFLQEPKALLTKSLSPSQWGSIFTDTLMHDDIMDAAPLRRGRETVRMVGRKCRNSFG